VQSAEDREEPHAIAYSRDRRRKRKRYNEFVLSRSFFVLVLALVPLAAAPPVIMPLKDVSAGQRGVGRTVFAGTKVEEFQVEVLGVLNNVGPKESIILAKLSGGPLGETGVMQGMSGSPVYIGGKLIGAVALSFPLSKEAIAGIRPIEDMLRMTPEPARQIAGLPARRSYFQGDSRMEEIATPVSFSGFTAGTLEHFGPQLRQLGFDPRQGVAAGGPVPDVLGDPKTLEPGSMISVQLISGDMTVGADGTITAIDGDKVYAFGHRFLSEGSTDFPFARAEVLALLPSLQSSFKISMAKEWMGTITSDREVAVAGLTGRRANLVPMEIRVGANTYRMRMIQDRVMSPLLLQMAIFSAIDATERSLGAQTYSIKGQIEFDGGPVKIDDVYSGDLGVASVAAGSVSSSVGFAYQSGLDALKLKSVNLDIVAVERKSQQQIIDVLAPRMAHPGDDLDVTVVLGGANGQETSRKVRYKLPVGVPLGPLNLTVADATATNIFEFQQAVGTPQRTPEQVLGLLNGLRSNTKAYLRVWRSEPAYTVEGRDIPDPPPSLALTLTRAQGTLQNLQSNNRGAKLAELEVAGSPGFIVTGSKTVQVEVKE